MKKLLTMGALVCAAALPATAVADEPTPAQFKNASKYCKALKAASGSNFASLYKNHGKCVSSVAKAKNKQDDQQAAAAKSEATQECKTERGTTPESIALFNAKYGTNENDKNAYGKCRSQQAKQNRTAAEKLEKQQDQNKVNAAKECKTERGTTPASRTAFANTYGTNANKKNAFGKCVSQKAKAKNQEQTTTQS